MLMRSGALKARAVRPLQDRRAETREQGLVDRASLVFRGEAHEVRVVDISARGTRIETDISARLGESVLIRFEQCTAIRAFVRWQRDGEIGLNFGHELVLG